MASLFQRIRTSKLSLYEKAASSFGARMRDRLTESRFLRFSSDGEPYCHAAGRSLGIVIVPNHREIDTGTLRGIIRQAELTVDEFLDLLA